MDPARRLVTAQLTSALGDGAFIVTSALYLVRVVGLTPGQVGLGLTIGWGAGFLTSAPIGRLADRRGLRGTATLLALGTACALGLLVTVQGMAGFVAGAVVYGITQSGLGGVRQALVASLVAPAERLVVRARLQATQNAGLAVGAAVGGAAIAVDRPWSYLSVLGLDALAFLVTAVLLHRLPVVTRAVRVGAPPASVLRDRPFVAVAALNAAMLLYMPMLSVVLPLWVAERTGAPRWTVSALFVLNTLAVMAAQVRVARRVDGLRAAGRAVRAAGVLFLATCACFALSGTPAALPALGLLLLGALLQVAGEMLLASGSWTIAFDLAPADRQGEYQSFFASGVAVARTVGPAALTALVLSGGTVGWLVLGVVFLAAATATPPVVRLAAQRSASSRSTSASGGQDVRPRRATA